MKVVTYYIVSVLTEEVKDLGIRVTQDDQLCWLSDDEGYMSHTKHKKGAYRFKHKPSSVEISSYSGCPWYYVHKKGSEKIYKIVETIYENTYEETLV